jgi:acyl dehydratase
VIPPLRRVAVPPATLRSAPGLPWNGTLERTGTSVPGPIGQSAAAPPKHEERSMALTVFEGIDDVKGAVGRHLGTSEWVEITQARIDQFAEATGDHQWIHVDPEKAAAGPFGTTIAHGYLTLSLSNFFLPQVVEVRGVSMGVNYGVNKVRFPAPVPVGSKVRAGVELVAVQDIPGGVQTTMVVTIEREGGDKPVCVIESLSRFLS